MRIIDWADTASDARTTPYKRIQKAKATFLKYMPCLERENDHSPNQVLWSSILEKAQKYFGTVWWKNGLFPGRDDGVPLCVDVHEGCQDLIRILEELLPEVNVAESIISCASPIVAQEASDLCETIRHLKT